LNGQESPIGCKVTGEKVETKSLTATTVGGEEKFLKFSPSTGTEFAVVPLEGCSNAGLNERFPVTGSVKIAPHGATLISTHEEVTTQGTLKFGGQKAGLAGSLTLSGKKEGGSEAATPLTVTNK